MDDTPLSTHLADTVAALKHLLQAQADGLPRVVRPPRPAPAPAPAATARAPATAASAPGPARVPAAPAPARGPAHAAPPPETVPLQAPPTASVLPLPDDEPWPDLDLAAIGALVAGCTRCDLAATRMNTVFGEGATDRPAVMFVGEGPGAEEDKAGRPFVGPAGQLLDNMIRAMGLRREDCYIANVVKCRPPNNAVPRPDQSGPCLPYLYAQIRRIRPRFIVALGATAAKALFGRPEVSVGRLRGRFHRLGDIPLVVTYHPAALLRDPSFKRPAWDDLKLVMARLKTGG
jgi:DNA polymerase